MIQQIMERFGTREEVPDEWWAIMGLENDRDQDSTTPATVEQPLVTAEEVMQELSSQRELETGDDMRADTTAQEAPRV